MSDGRSRVSALLALARRLGLARLDAQGLVAHALGRSRTWVLAHEDDPLDDAACQSARRLLERRAAGEPYAYLVGEREFHGLNLRVTPDVLVPRPDTEVLVDWALDLLSGLPGVEPNPDVVDLGTGSGAIALAVKLSARKCRMTAVDASEAALRVAKENANRLGLALEFVASDWWQALGGRRFHLALSNPPYIAGDDPHLTSLAHEPTLALTPGGDGLGAIRILASQAPLHLHPGGWLLVEHGHDQGEAVREILREAGFVDVSTRLDIEGRDRCTGGRLPGEAWTQRP